MICPPLRKTCCPWKFRPLWTIESLLKLSTRLLASLQNSSLVSVTRGLTVWGGWKALKEIWKLRTVIKKCLQIFLFSWAGQDNSAPILARLAPVWNLEVWDAFLQKPQAWKASLRRVLMYLLIRLWMTMPLMTLCCKKSRVTQWKCLVSQLTNLASPLGRPTANQRRNRRQCWEYAAQLGTIDLAYWRPRGSRDAWRQA